MAEKTGVTGQAVRDAGPALRQYKAPAPFVKGPGAIWQAPCERGRPGADSGKGVLKASLTELSWQAFVAERPANVRTGYARRGAWDGGANRRRAPPFDVPWTRPGYAVSGHQSAARRERPAAPCIRNRSEAPFSAS